MKFSKYNSLTNVTNLKSLTYIASAVNLSSTPWAVTEKIHGANYGFWVDPDGNFKVSKRTSFIPEEAKFYGQKFVIEAHKDAFKKAALELYPGKTVTLYGELAGGTNNDYNRAVQKEVFYDDDFKFYAFDLMVDGVIQSREAMVKFCTAADIALPPLLGVFYTLEEALAVSNEFDSKVANIENNICEGVVISPLKPLFTPLGDRVIFKSKNDKFLEVSKTPKKTGKSTELAGEYLATLSTLLSYVTPQRFDNVLSKLEEDYVTFKNFGGLLGLFLEDAFEEYEDEVAKVGKDVKEAIKKPLHGAAARVVREKLNSLL